MTWNRFCLLFVQQLLHKTASMIKAILVFNNAGKPRLTKFFSHYAEDAQQQILRETFQLVCKRDGCVCNFLETGTSLLGSMDFKLVYRHYATLYFVFCVDSSESDLGILDLIQVFVESLDKCFENVCELDMIFHVDKVHYIINEMVMGGMVLETSIREVVEHYQQMVKHEKEDRGTAAVHAVKAGVASAPTRAVAAFNTVKHTVNQKF